MKRFGATFAVLLLVVFGLSASTTPENPSTGLFKDDLKSFDQDFSELNRLEQTVQNTGKDYNQLKAENHQDLNALDYNGDVSNALLGGSGDFDDRLAGIPGFLWGFCLGWVGILLVYLLIDDPAAKKHQGRQAIVGCIVSSLVWIVFWILFYGANGYY